MIKSNLFTKKNRYWAKEAIACFANTTSYFFAIRKCNVFQGKNCAIIVYIIIKLCGGKMFEVSKEEYVNKTFRLKRPLVAQLQAYAAKKGISLNSLVAQCCEFAMLHKDMPPKAK